MEDRSMVDTKGGAIAIRLVCWGALTTEVGVEGRTGSERKGGFVEDAEYMWGVEKWRRMEKECFKGEDREDVYVSRENGMK